MSFVFSGEWSNSTFQVDGEGERIGGEQLNSGLDQGCKWHYKKFSEMLGSRGRIGPGGVKGQRPCGGPNGALPPGRN